MRSKCDFLDESTVMKVNSNKNVIISPFPKSSKDQVVMKGTIIVEDCIRFSKEVEM